MIAQLEIPHSQRLSFGAPLLRPRRRRSPTIRQRVVVLTVSTGQVPHVPNEQRLSIQPLGHDMFNVRVQYGFMEDPCAKALAQGARAGAGARYRRCDLLPRRETVIVTRREGMAIWREKLVMLMARNAIRATAFFRLPPERVVELGVQVEMLRVLSLTPVKPCTPICRYR
jgi:KUP system potassium uptake protein